MRQSNNRNKPNRSYDASASSKTAGALAVTEGWSDAFEIRTCSPLPLDDKGFNPKTHLPFGLAMAHIRAAMTDFLEFLGFI